MTYNLSENIASNGDFYDGISPIPVRVNVSVQDDCLQLAVLSLEGRRDDMPSMIPYSQLKNITLVGGKLRIELLNDLHPKARYLLILEDTKLKAVIEEHWNKDRKSFFLQFSLKFKNYGLLRKVVIALIVVPIFASIFLFFSFQAYKLIPLSWEVNLGEMFYKQMVKEDKICKAPELNRILNQTVQSLKQPESPYSYHITVVKDSMVNAYAMPGKRIVLFTGLLEASNSLEEVTAVLAHEMSHIDKQHGLQNMVRVLGISYLLKLSLSGMNIPETFSDIVTQAALLKYSKEFEREADILAVQKLHQKKISVKPFIAFFNKLADLRIEGKPLAINDKKGKKKQAESVDKPEDKDEESISEWLSTHPSDKERIKYLTDKLKEEKFIERKSPTSQKQWKKLKMSCGATKSDGMHIFIDE